MSSNTSGISLFHKILVLVEDKGEVSLDELTVIGPQRQTLGALGRLEGLGYIERTKKKEAGTRITITERGDEVLSDILDFLPDRDKKWDEKWRMILFDIPESKRTVRQMFRLKLLDLGARMFQSSVWITPYDEIREKFDAIVQESGYSKQVHYFEAECVSPQPIDIESIWQLNDLHNEYKTLFKTLEKQVSKLNKKNDNTSYEAKCMIVALALVSKRDPQLPKKLMPNNWIGDEVHQWHERLRSYCTN